MLKLVAVNDEAQFQGKQATLVRVLVDVAPSKKQKANGSARSLL